jgi:glycosyltransferase involved in cell wall biosynthesis
VNKFNLLVINYVMDQNDRLLSHQVEIVEEIAKQMDKIQVLTGRVGKVPSIGNVTIKSYSWVQGKNLKNIFRLLFSFFQQVRHSKVSVVFSHMTLSQSIIILPLTKLFRIRHFVWYAHKSKNRLLNITYRMFDGILTSTLDSCPVESDRVFPIGQTINSKNFPINLKIEYPVSKLLHIGRFDPIKKIEDIIFSVEKLRRSYPNLTLDIVGSASSENNLKYEISVKTMANKFVNEGWLKFYPSVTRESIPSLLSNHDCFVHACDAAIDKVILEATISKVPVVTTNVEYLKEFGSWGEYRVGSASSLDFELDYLLRTSEDKLIEEVQMRYLRTMERHELKGWVERLIEIIKP